MNTNKETNKQGKETYERKMFTVALGMAHLLLENHIPKSDAIIVWEMVKKINDLRLS